jgi:hypothetical protein
MSSSHGRNRDFRFLVDGCCRSLSVVRNKVEETILDPFLLAGKELPRAQRMRMRLEDVMVSPDSIYYLTIIWLLSFS